MRTRSSTKREHKSSARFSLANVDTLIPDGTKRRKEPFAHSSQQRKPPETGVSGTPGALLKTATTRCSREGFFFLSPDFNDSLSPTSNQLRDSAHSGSSQKTYLSSAHREQANQPTSAAGTSFGPLEPLSRVPTALKGKRTLAPRSELTPCIQRAKRGAPRRTRGGTPPRSFHSVFG